MGPFKRLGVVVALALGACRASAPADLILHNGKIVTVDRDFSIAQAVSIKDGRIQIVGNDRDVLTARGPATRVVDLGGKMVLPGLIDSHSHALDAAMYEFDHEIPPMASIPDVLDYVRARAATLREGEWIRMSQVFVTRLKERRYPTRAELDAAAPKNPVLFATGPDAMLNSAALAASGIDRAFAEAYGGPGRVERDPATGEPSGMLRSCTSLAKASDPASTKRPTERDRIERGRAMLRDYNSVGITSIGDRATSPSEVKLYRALRDRGELTVRVAASMNIDTGGRVEEIQAEIRRIAADPLVRGDPMLRIIGVKTFLDGGMLTGSAFMREPWGVSKIYMIDDPTYRGLRYIPEEKLVSIVRAALESGLQFTAHSVGDGAVHALVDAYEKVNATLPVRERRPCVTHCNFMSAEVIEKMRRLGVVADIQPAWLWLDTRTLALQFGYDRMRWFQPIRTLFEKGVIVGGGSDHMQKLGSLRSVNPYNPFLGMWVWVTRRAQDYDRPLHPEEAVTREQAIRAYTINNAFLLFAEREVGSLEPGKRADLIVMDRDLLTCPEDQLRDAQVLATYLDGRPVYEKKP
jgi:predicted amidohydrolase YtcJ